ncbi:GSCFA family protein [Fibrobacter sp. UWT2]|uniref:GSCFA domain-containing protein n=1 Tax=Fibrobacter sp. UWT2 TaxID=1896224 RepID=UPI0009190DF9|nr:GSCFA domain-containing protein [Fibrobacter sp. UWT2]SHK65218.1 GSCFA family protein [Fibrobacter sp. UWT2]
MNFFTKIDIPAADFKIDYTSRLAFFGSCFADNISALFAERKFNVLANPFGTVYNPVSLASQIKAIADGKVFGEEDVFQDTRCDRLWHCWDAHSSLSSTTKEECIGKLNAAATQARDFLQKANVIFITLGSAFVYYLKDSGKPVANCHRQDPSQFERKLISVDEAAEAIQRIVTLLRDMNRDARIVFTVSPIRHLGDGAHGNNLSKATVLLAINKEIATSPLAPRNDNASRASAGVYSRICETQQSCASRNDTVDYFPSYEIVMDELRDYRFYSDDMIHLSKTAEEYIFERMVETYCDSATRENMAKVEKFLKTANHRIQDENSPATQELKKKLATQATELEKQIAGLKLG